MKRDSFFKGVLLTAAVLFSVTIWGQKVSELKFYNVQQLIESGDAVMIGQGEKPTADSCYYYRIPNRLKDVVRKELWQLGCDGAGIAIRFSTDATCIGARWTLTYNFGMSHMAYTGIKGMDLYVLNNPKKKEWKFAGTAFPNGKNSANIFVKKMYGGKKEYMIYLPLYDGVDKMEIGIDSSATIFPPQGELLPGNNGLPILFYGTSITQGGCVSRPGMAYPAIIERKLGKETINLGFSGNGRMDGNMADWIKTIPVSAYVLDCLPNCTYNTTRDSSDYFIGTIAAANPNVPVYLVNNFEYPQQFILPGNNDDMVKENKLIRDIYKRLKTKGAEYTDPVTGERVKTGPLKNLHFIDVSKKRGIGNEDTVDGNHMTDLGTTNFSNRLLKHLK
ncbi:MAG: SGNH/GDSL hydrolase family protein [Bacteroidales bacterium]|nr:SGNH/GDSL hydrolase family protein [Bacteroidales bacterium]